MENFLNPSEILKKLELRSNMTAADFGCGSGGWVLPLAMALQDGRVFAIDISDEPLSALRSKAKLQKIFNIETQKANVEKGTLLLSGSCDLVLMTNLLFQISSTPERLTSDVSALTSEVDSDSGVKRVLEEAKRVLKSDGQLLIVDWKKDNPLTREIEKVSAEEIKNIAEGLGLKAEKEFEAGSYHFGLILLK